MSSFTNWYKNNDETVLRKRIKTQSISQIIVGFLFLILAIVVARIEKEVFDMELALFSLVIIAGIIGFYSIRKKENISNVTLRKILILYSVMTCFSHLMVIINYILAILIGQWILSMYIVFGFAVFMWCFTAIIFTFNAIKLYIIAKESSGDINNMLHSVEID